MAVEQPAPKTSPEEKPAEEKKPAPSVGQTARDYMIPMSQSAANEWRTDREGFLEHAKQVASGLYPTLAPQIAQGHTVKNLLDPYVQVAKSVLGPDTEPDWQDPKWTKVLEGGVDPVTNRPTIMPLSAFREYLHTEPGFGFAHSPAAHERADGFAQALNQSFSGMQ